MRRALGMVVMLAFVCYLATGLAVVQQDEVGIVRRFGAPLGESWQPGLHWGLPWGLDRLDRVKTGQTRTLTVGARSAQSAPLARMPDPVSDDFLTGDLNLVTAQAVLQYRISNPADYLFSATSIDAALTLATESALTRALTERRVDDVLTTSRAEIATRIERAVQELADRERLGISVRSVGSRLRCRSRPHLPTPIARAATAVRPSRVRTSIATEPGLTLAARPRKSQTAATRSTIVRFNWQKARPTDSAGSWPSRARLPSQTAAGSTSRRSRSCSRASAARSSLRPAETLISV